MRKPTNSNIAFYVSAHSGRKQWRTRLSTPASSFRSLLGPATGGKPEGNFFEFAMTQNASALIGLATWKSPLGYAKRA